jgi:predicted Abi (CAAX) family protease
LFARAPVQMNTRVADAWAAVCHLPDRREWLGAGLELLWAVPLIALVAHSGDLVTPGVSPDTGTLAQLGVTLLVAPALGEELLFRAALIPRRAPRVRWIALSVALFVLWHPLQALTFGPPWAVSFLDPWFLAATALLGLALARIYVASGSLWPCVITHWLVVLAWKAFLGGPF